MLFSVVRHSLSARHRAAMVTTNTTAAAARRHFGFWSTAKDFWSKLIKADDPREEKEWKDLTVALVSLNHRRLRLENPGKDPNALIDTAYQGLEKKFLDMNNVGLRYELNDALTPLILEVLETFQNVDDRLGSPPESMEEGSRHQKILLDEYADTLRRLAELDTTAIDTKESLNRPSPAVFLRRKSGALGLLLEHYGWLNRQEVPLSSATENSQTQSSHPLDDQLDDFGYNESANDDDVTKEIRHYQAINLVRSALLRQELDYSAVTLKSTLPGAGRGVFVDGKAMAGSLVAFVPGEVWPKEHLLKMTVGLRKHFSNDENDQLTMRADEAALIDSRRSPYTVLTEESSNPWALAHIVNHPPRNAMPNCRLVMINFTEHMKLESAGLMHYVPNSYAKKPMLLGAKSFDRDRFVMLGLGLQAVRDVWNEELFLDYRLSPSKAGHPSWYHEIDQEEVAAQYQDELSQDNR